MNWPVITDNWLFFLIGAWPHGPLGGLVQTCLLALGGGALATVLGLASGLALWAGWGGALLRWGCEFLRAIPVLLLMFWCYFLLPIVFGLDVPGTWTVIVALGLVSGAYLAYAVQAGLQAVPRGQWEAAQASGMRRGQILRWIVLPQALRIIRPSWLNQWVTLVKDTSLAYIVGVADFTLVANQVNSREQVYALEIFLFIGLVYWALCASLQWCGERYGRIAVRD
ncbi:amino acid ABC transporter permease [Chitinibacter tainanensis]|uniref:amino acid ABC transporter permease n=1 Tax=Chitinibacter tainanensis TaxID=230667 RepID=UPI0023547F7B|nr:amino acid ABC transporter permease [Chitinibacter tainanensis]